MLQDLIAELPPWALRSLLFLGIFVLFKVAKKIHEAQRIRRVGLRAQRYPTRFPFGLDLILKSIPRRQNQCPSLGLWRTFLQITSAHSRTAEADVGGMRTILTADPENLKAILSTQFSSFGKGAKFNKDWHEFLGNGIFSTDGTLWSDGRALVRAQLVREQLSDTEVFERHASRLLPMLEQGAVDIRPLMFAYTLDIATDFLLGNSVDDLHDPKNEFAAAFAFIQQFHAQVALFNSFIERFVDQVLALSSKELENMPDTFLKSMVDQTRDRKVIRDQIASVLLAGRDTTACTLSWLLYELAFAPEIVKSLRKEIVDTIGQDGTPTFEQLKSMRLLQRCTSETLRLYPAVPLNVRIALEDTSLPRGGGLNGTGPVGVLQGTQIFYSTQFLQLSDECYDVGQPDPAIFEPNRWDEWRPRHHSYIPFNAGPRLCAGQQFALTEIGYTIVRLLQKFKSFEPQDDLLKHNSRRPLPVGSDTLPARVYACRIRMKNEVVLQPHDPLPIRFVE